MIWFALYILTIFAANWALVTFGVVTVAGLSAPAGVLFAGLAFVLRNQTQETLGRRWSVAAIPIGALLSAFLSPTFALASGTAFLLAESLDYVVYQPLRRQGRIRAMLVSCACGDVADSALFLLLAFGSLQFIEGQLIGKWLTVGTVVVGMAAWRTRDLRGTRRVSEAR
jgi:uncharacterized PurR-regulated membrane protein YhhQ (DUF165 family)